MFVVTECLPGIGSIVARFSPLMAQPKHHLSELSELQRVPSPQSRIVTRRRKGNYTQHEFHNSLAHSLQSQAMECLSKQIIKVNNNAAIRGRPRIEYGSHLAPLRPPRINAPTRPIQLSPQLWMVSECQSRQDQDQSRLHNRNVL
jgi:hypothetical protein